MWVTTACSGCGKKQRVEVKIPDVRSRVAAIELLLREGLGRPAQAEEAASPRLPRTAEAVEKLGWDDMKAIVATHFASEIAAVTEHGGDALLRERVAALDHDQRQLLRETLDEVKIASEVDQRLTSLGSTSVHAGFRLTPTHEVGGHHPPPYRRSGEWACCAGLPGARERVTPPVNKLRGDLPGTGFCTRRPHFARQA